MQYTSVMFTDVNVEHSLVIQRSITSIDRYSQAICIQTTSNVSTVEHTLTIPDDLFLKDGDLNTVIPSWKMKPLSLKVWISRQPLVSSKDFKSQALIVCHI